MSAILKRGCVTSLKLRGLLHSTAVPSASRLVVHEEVEDALARGRAVVALESTIITHGLPFPENMNMALKVESIVRAGGATPATIALQNGRAHVGISESDIRRLAENKEHAIKVSRRDIAYVLSKSLTGGTTISATMVLARMAGIDVFVTGGLGGVHRGGESSMDVSADLTELGRTPVAVVCSGVKSILDIGRTLEFLETQGAFVASYGEHDDFPAFFTAKSGFKAPYKLRNAEEAAHVVHASLSVGLDSGLVIAVPVPESAAGSDDEELIDQSIRSALTEAEEKGITGKRITPFVLSRVSELSKGASLKTNLALVYNNARVGTSIAVELASLRRQQKQQAVESFVQFPHVPLSERMSVMSSLSMQLPQGHSCSDTSRPSHGRFSDVYPTRRPVVIGGSVLDCMASVSDPRFQFDGATYNGTVRHSCGGVGRNLADGLTRLRISPIFLSAIGQDLHADLLQRMSSHLDWKNVKVSSLPTAVYDGFLRDTGDVLFGIGDMGIHTQVDVDYVRKYESQISEAAFVCLDGNLSAEVINYVLKLCKQQRVMAFFEPTDVSKAAKPFLGGTADCITISKPNFSELVQMHTASMSVTPATVNVARTVSEHNVSLDAAGDCRLGSSVRMCRRLVSTIPILIVTLGSEGVLICRSLKHADGQYLRDLKCGKIIESDDAFEARHYDALPVIQKVSASGAGDSFGAALLAGIYLGHDGDTCVRGGLRAAQLSLLSYDTISASINNSIFSY